MAKLTAGDGNHLDSFGFSVSISGGYAIVGAYGDDDNGDNSGSAYFFERNGVNWSQVAKLTGGNGDRFGVGVSIWGNYAIVGAQGDDDRGNSSGATYIYERTGGIWKYVAKLTAGDGEDYDRLGTSVSITDGYAVAGAVGNHNETGAAYLIKRNGGSWSLIAKLTAGDGFRNDWFGSSVSVSEGYVVVGAYGDDDNAADSGSAYIYDWLLSVEPNQPPGNSIVPLLLPLL